TAEELNVRGDARLLESLLTITSREARALLISSERFAPTRALTGEQLPPQFDATAAAISDGSLAWPQAEVVADVVASLPASVKTENGDAVERPLVAHGRDLSTMQLRALGRRICAHLDPDGPEPSERDRREQARRELFLGPGPDGMTLLTATLTPACAAVWRT